MAPSSAASPDREMLDLYSTYGLYLAEEGRLIDNRLTSNLTIQGFLFAAYSFSLQKIVDVKVNLLNTAVDRKRVAQLEIPHTIHGRRCWLCSRWRAWQRAFLFSSVYWRLVCPSMK
jgi:hypothetical protein